MSIQQPPELAIAQLFSPELYWVTFGLVLHVPFVMVMRSPGVSARQEWNAYDAFGEAVVRL